MAKKVSKKFPAKTEATVYEVQQEMDNCQAGKKGIFSNKLDSRCEFLLQQEQVGRFDHKKKGACVYYNRIKDTRSMGVFFGKQFLSLSNSYPISKKGVKRDREGQKDFIV